MNTSSKLAQCMLYFVSLRSSILSISKARAGFVRIARAGGPVTFVGLIISALYIVLTPPIFVQRGVLFHASVLYSSLLHLTFGSRKTGVTRSFACNYKRYKTQHSKHHFISNMNGSPSGPSATSIKIAVVRNALYQGIS